MRHVHLPEGANATTVSSDNNIKVIVASVSLGFLAVAGNA